MRTCTSTLLLVLLGIQAGALCNVPRPRLVCAEYFHSKAVVIARLAGTTTVKDDFDDVTGRYYSLTVEQTLRGEVPRLFRVYVANDSGRTTFDWKQGGSYLLSCGNKRTTAPGSSTDAVIPARRTAKRRPSIRWTCSTAPPIVPKYKVRSRGYRTPFRFEDTG